MSLRYLRVLSPLVLLVSVCASSSASPALHPKGATPILSTRVDKLSLNLSPNSVAGGVAVAAVVSYGTAVAEDTVVTLKSDNDSATVPSTVIISKGSTLAPFSIATTDVSSKTTVNISATTSKGDTATAPLIITSNSAGAGTGTASTTKGAAFAVLFSLQNNTATGIAAVSYDFTSLAHFVGWDTSPRAVTGSSFTSQPPTLADSPAGAGGTTLTEDIANQRKTILQTPTPEEQTAINLYQERHPGKIWYRLRRTPGNRFLLITSSKTQLDELTGSLTQKTDTEPIIPIDKLGQVVNEKSQVVDDSGKVKTEKTLPNTKTKTSSLNVVNPSTGNSSQQSVSTIVQENELYLTLLSGVQASSSNSSSSSSSGSSSSGSSGGFGLGLRFGFDGGNESFFIGPWFADYQWKQCHLAIGFTINVLNK